MKPSLREALTEWTDWYTAAYRLAICLGLMHDKDGLFQTRAKHVFW